MTIEKLFLHAKETKRLELEGVISPDISSSFLRQIEPEIVKNLDLSNYYSFIESNQIDYWYKLFYPTQEKVISQLKKLMQKDANNSDITQRLITDFLSYDIKTKKDFYLKNFIENKKDNYNREIFLINGASYPQINMMHHNIHTLYLSSNRYEEKILLNSICTDIQKTLNLSKTEFQKTFSPGLVNFSSAEQVKRNWYQWGMVDNPNLRSIYAIKYFNRNTPHALSTSFLSDIQKGIIEADIKTPKGLSAMGSLIGKELHGIYNHVQDFKKEDFLNKLKITKSILETIKQYDLSFIDYEKINQYWSQINKNTNIIKGFDEDCRKELLDLSLSIQLLKENKTDKIEKKIKI